MEEIFIINSYNRSLNAVLGEGVKLKKISLKVQYNKSVACTSLLHKFVVVFKEFI